LRRETGGRGQHGGIAEAHGRKRVVAVVSPDVEMEVSHLDRLLLLAPPHVPFRLDDALNPASAREDLDALSDQHLGRPAAEATEEENAVVVDVGDDQADLVNVAEEREQRRFLTGRTNPRDRASHPVDLDLVGELGRGLAPDRRRLGLEARRAGACNSRRSRSGAGTRRSVLLDEPVAQPVRWPAMSPARFWGWTWRHERGGSLRLD